MPNLCYVRFTAVFLKLLHCISSALSSRNFNKWCYTVLFYADTLGSVITLTCLYDCLQEADFLRPLKRSSGIPNSFMRPVVDLNQPGVMLTSSGHLAVPTIDAYVYLLSHPVTVVLM